MDLKTRLRQLQEARTAGYIDESEFQELRADLLNALRNFTDLSKDSSDATKKPDTPPISNHVNESLSVDEQEADLGPITLCLEMLKPELEIGPSNHRFRLARMLGESKASQVWLAYDLSAHEAGFDQYKALKIFAPRREDSFHSDDPGKENPAPGVRAEQYMRGFLVRVRARATLAAAINHTHIVKVYGWRLGKDGWPFIEMEYLAGQNLAQLLSKEGKPGLPLTRILDLLGPAAVALDYAHQYHRVPHRHLTLENIFITDQGLIKLLDFGLAYQPRDGSNLLARNPEPDSALPRFFTPESQSMNQGRLKQDIRALVALIYQLLTGKSLYYGEAAATQLYPVKEKLPQPSSLTENAWRVLSRHLQQEQDAALPTAGELLTHLQVVQDTSKGSRRSPMLRRVVLVALLGLSLVGLYGWYGPQTDLWHELQKAWYGFLKEPLPSSLQESGADVAQAIDMPPPKTLAATPSPVADDTKNLDAKLDQATENEVTRRETDDRAFAAAARIDTVSAYEIYLQRCPDCGHRETVETAISRLQRETHINTLKTRFDQALSQETRDTSDQDLMMALAILDELANIDAQNDFLIKAKQRIVLAYVELAKKEIAATQFDQARRWLAKGRTIQSDHPALTQLTLALDKTEAKYQDDTAFAKAEEHHIRTAYQAYLDHCAPLCGHRQAATAALEHLKSEPPSNSNRIFRDTLTTGEQGPDMVLIPAGVFHMGSSLNETGRLQDENQRQIQIVKPFAIGRYEVTFNEYARFVAETQHREPKDEGWGRGKRPVINVTWQDATAYSAWLANQTGEKYRLPTEAEWEYAARAGMTTSRYWGDNPDQGCAYANGADLVGQTAFAGWTVMNCNDGYVYTAPVGSFQPNAFGLFDMLGNVLEWTCSSYEESYREAALHCAEKNPTRQVVARGGSWSDQPRGVRAADRHKATPDSYDYFIGFRVARDL
jgi:formylglycine-generating enzyme required for sulfatase activity/serine/threonine protein kinase